MWSDDLAEATFVKAPLFDECERLALVFADKRVNSAFMLTVSSLTDDVLAAHHCDVVVATFSCEENRSNAEETVLAPIVKTNKYFRLPVW